MYAEEECVVCDNKLSPDHNSFCNFCGKLVEVKCSRQRAFFINKSYLDPSTICLICLKKFHIRDVIRDCEERLKKPRGIAQKRFKEKEKEEKKLADAQKQLDNQEDNDEYQKVMKNMKQTREQKDDKEREIENTTHTVKHNRQLVYDLYKAGEVKKRNISNVENKIEELEILN